MANRQPFIRLTRHSLEKLKQWGFRYVVVESYTIDRRSDFIEMNHFLLKPLKEMPGEPGELGIFESIDSQILREWADHPDSGIKAFIDTNDQPA